MAGELAFRDEAAADYDREAYRSPMQPLALGSPPKRPSPPWA
jgi:hypothetical protein